MALVNQPKFKGSSSTAGSGGNNTYNNKKSNKGSNNVYNNKRNDTGSVYNNNICIEEFDESQFTHHTYKIRFYNERIHTTVTNTASEVDAWISKIYSDFHNKLNNLIVGLDCEWKVNWVKGGARNRIAVLQLCVAHECLIFQFKWCDYIPVSLYEFLNNKRFIFVGVGVDEDGDKLFDDYRLTVAKTIDLRALAVKKLKNKGLRRSGLKSLADTVLARDLPKPKKVTLSKWDAGLLTKRQIQYACLDAFVSFKLGYVLMHGFNESLEQLFAYHRK